MNGRFTYSSNLISASGTKTLGYLLQQLNTHDQFDKFDIFVKKITYTGNAGYLAHVWIGSPSGNIMSLYLDEIFSALKWSTNLLVN